MGLFSYFFIFLAGLFSTLVMIPSLQRWAIETGAVDKPGLRKIHQQPIPRVGGIAVFVGCLFALLVFVEMNRQIRGMAAGALVIFFTGLVDDLYGLSPKKKFLGQIVGCLVAMAVGSLYIHRMGDLLGFGPIDLPLWIAVPFTVFGVVGVVNAFNLIDGLDGLAGGLAAIALGTFFLLAFQEGNPEAMAVSAALLGAVLGFLKYNSYPARIFLGDTGSLTIGFLLAMVGISLTQTPTATVRPAVPLVILGLPILDTLWVMSRRVLQRKNPFLADQTHVHHKFLNLGFDHRLTVITLYGISLFWAVVVVLLMRHFPGYVIFYGYLSGSLGFYLLLRHLDRNREQFPLLARDSSRSLRQSSIYLKMAGYCRWTVPSLKLVILFYLVLAALSSHRVDPLIFWPALGVFLAGFGLLLVTRDTGNHFLMSMLYLAGFVIVFQAEQTPAVGLLDGGIFKDLSAGLFVLGGALAALRIFFREPGVTFLSTPLDFLIMAMSVSLAVVSPELNEAYRLAEVVAKSIILFVAIKVVAVSERSSTRLIFSTVQASLLAILVRSTF